jgi:hypothetical protein
MMARRITTVILARGRGGHRLYLVGSYSDCAYHKFCAYDGTEKLRCPRCHVSVQIGCEHNWGGMPPGSRPCLCRGCGEIFSSNSAFDSHRSGFACKPPEKCGLVLAERGDWTIWALPGAPPER